jgi:predicted amino acid dehydrogenase
MVGVELRHRDDSESALIRVLAEQDQLASFVAGSLLREHRVRVLPTLSAKSTLRLEPSAFVERTELDRFVDALAWTCDVLRRDDTYRLARYAVGREGRDATWRRRPQVATPASSQGAARVGFLAHFLSPDELRHWEPGLGPFSDAECAEFLDRTGGVIEPFIVGRTALRSPTGAEAEILIYGVPFLPDQVMAAMREGQDAWARSMVVTGLELAKAAGCTVVGFGGYTSIVTNNCLAVDARGVAVTSGNSLTAAAGLEAMLSAAQRLELSPLRLGVVGAAGNIGAILAELAAPEVDEIVLIGRDRTRRRLDDLAERLAGATRVRVATELAALRDCNVILTATNSPRPVVLPEHVSSDPVVIADIAVPGDVDPAVLRERPRALVLHGGVVRAPMEQTIDIDGMNLAPGQLYGCLAEAVILGLAGVTDHFSRGPLEADKVRHVRELAREHGFSVAEDAALR